MCPSKFIDIFALRFAIGSLDDFDEVDLLQQRAVLRVEPDLATRRIKGQGPHCRDELGAVLGHLTAELFER